MLVSCSAFAENERRARTSSNPRRGPGHRSLNIISVEIRFKKPSRLCFRSSLEIAERVWCRGWNRQVPFLCFGAKKYHPDFLRSSWSDCRRRCILDMLCYLSHFSNKHFWGYATLLGTCKMLFDWWYSLNVMFERAIPIPLAMLCGQTFSIVKTFVDWHDRVYGVNKNLHTFKQTFQRQLLCRADSPKLAFIR